MKICIYAHSFPPIIGGAQTYQYNLALGLAELGHRVLVITGKVPSNLDNRIKDYYSKSFRVVRLPSFRKAAQMMAPFRELLAESFKILRKFDPDIVYSNGYIPGLVISILSDGLRAKHVFSYHSTPELQFKKIAGIWPGNLSLELALTRFIMKQCPFDVYLACSNNYLNFTKRYLNPKTKRALMVYYGVDMKKFSPGIKASRSHHHLKNNDLVILCPVRLIERKGIFDILKAVKLLKKMLGEGEVNIKLLMPTSNLTTRKKFKKEVSKRIVDLGIKRDVIIKYDKFLPRDMPLLYAICDIVVLPSYAEGLGIVLLEAMAMKKPVVATNIPGINEVVKQEKTGLLVPVKNPFKIALAIKRLYQDQKLKNRLVKNAYSLIKKEFELNKQVGKVEKIFYSLKHG